MLSVSNNIHDLRVMYDLTQEELGLLVGLSQNTISEIENRLYNPSVLNALKFASVFHCNVDDIFKLVEVNECCNVTE